MAYVILVMEQDLRIALPVIALTTPQKQIVLDAQMVSSMLMKTKIILAMVHAIKLVLHVLVMHLLIALLATLTMQISLLWTVKSLKG